MKFYKEKNGSEIFAYEEDGSQDHLIGNKIQLSQKELESHLENASSSRVKKFTSLEFLDRFTPEEQLAIVGEAMTVATVKLAYDRLLAAQFIDVEDKRVGEGLDVLVSAKLITKKRKDQILSGAEA